MATQQRLDQLFQKYEESDFKNLLERYEETAQQYKVATNTRKDFKKIESYPHDITLSTSSIRKFIADEIKQITPPEIVDKFKKRLLEKKVKENEKKKRKYQASHGKTCSK